MTSFILLPSPTSSPPPFPTFATVSLARPRNFMIPFGTLEIACAGSLAMFLAELSGLLAAVTSEFLNSSVRETPPQSRDRVDLLQSLKQHFVSVRFENTKV